MEVLRFSAIEHFGIPIDNPQLADTPKKIAGLMRAYSVKPEEVSKELTDITPYYWEQNAMRYYLGRRDGDGPAVVDIMPRHSNARALGLAPSATAPWLVAEIEPGTILVPGDLPAFALAGSSPRFDGLPCVHELIIPTALTE